MIGNIRFPRQLAAHTRDRTSADVESASGRADALLHLMGLSHAADAYPSQLSGGMQQRGRDRQGADDASPDSAHG